MSLAGVFLADIAEHPDDDAPRLVYADWLDDHGEPERAEFIRAQCDLARPRLTGGAQRRRDLKKRAQALFQEHGKHWAEGHGPWCPTWLRDWERGFPVRARVWATLATAARDLPNQLATAPLWSVTFLIRGLEDGEGKALAACPALARLRGLGVIGQGTWGDEIEGRARTELAVLLGSPFLRQLEAFELVQLSLGDDGLARLLAMERLGDLRFYGNRLGDAAARLICRSPVAARLTHLRLGENITVRTVRLIAQTPALARLLLLDLDQGHVGDTGAQLLAQAAHLSGLRELGLYSCDIGNDGAAALAASPYLTKLRELVLSRNRILYTGARSLIASTTLPRGMYLDLWDNELNDYTPEIRRGLRERFRKVNYGPSK